MPSPPPILDGELLAAFAAFAVERNFTRAAKEVGLSQPALFERVQRLSEAAGAPLYERRGRDLSLTPLGREVAAYARETLAKAQGFARVLRREPPRDEVILAAGEGAYLYLLGPAIEAVLGKIRVRPLTLGAPSAAEAVLSGEADLAVAVMDLVPAGLISRDILRTPLCAAVPTRHRLARLGRLGLTELASERLILAPEGQRHRDFVGRAVARLGLQVSEPLEADGWPLMLRFVELGLGVAIVNGVCAAPRGVVLRPIPELGSVTYRLLHRRGADLSAGTQALASAILELSRPSAPARARAAGASPASPAPPSRR